MTFYNIMDNEDYVIKRSGAKEVVSFDKILNRSKTLGNNELNINYTSLTVKIIDQLYDGIKTSEIDQLTAQQCASLATTHPDYEILASRILISNHHKDTDSDYGVVIDKLYNYKDIHGKHCPIISKEYYEFALKNINTINSFIDYNRDYLIDYFGFKTLERAYLMKVNGVIVERPQHMWVRVALSIHHNNLSKAKKSYELMSKKYFTHATPTLFNAGTPRPQLSSCYLEAMESDSIKGIYNTLSDCAEISKWAGGIGLHIHNIRCEGSHIRGTNGISNGIVPMLRCFNATARYVDQGGGKRAGSFAIYLEPWHGDIEAFLDMKKNHGDEEARARDLFYALWIPDEFMHRVKNDMKWTLMCPDKCPGLSDVYGDDFKKLYEKYENENKGIKTVPAREIWFKILDSQSETGVPYMLYKDACNNKSNQKNLGTIKSSNLCTEIIEYSNDEETAVCNLASIALPQFVKYKYPKGKYTIYTKTDCKWCKKLKILLKKINAVYDEVNLDDMEKWNEFFFNTTPKIIPSTVPQIFIDDKHFGDYTKFNNVVTPYYDYQLLHDITETVTENLNNVIDINFYPIEKTKRSNLKHRPIGIGVQGLADTFAILNIPFHSEEAKNVNKLIFETIYHAALTQSVKLAQKSQPYETFRGSPSSKGILQYDMWNVKPSNKWNWDKLKKDVVNHGIRNSLLLAPMPTASTSQILGFNECFEPFTSNIYVRRTIAGEFIRVNKYLMKELIELKLWNNDVKDEIIKDNGSIQNIDAIPQNIKDKYKIVWEIPMKHVLQMCADRGAFICQSQSTNLWMKNPTRQKLTAMHMYSWKLGLKTGIYYLRTKAKAAPQQFTIEPDKTNNIDDEEECLMCGS